MLPYQNLSLEDMPGEVWKDIPGWEGFYQASTMGRVKSTSHLSCSGKLLKNRIIRQNVYGRGYLNARLYRNGKSHSFPVARLVAFTFIPNPENKPTVDHINNIKFDNRVENLRWATYHENMSNPISVRRRKEMMRGVSFWQQSKSQPRKGLDNNRAHSIVGINPNTSEVRHYTLLGDCAKDGFTPSNVSKVCRKIIKHSGGWAFFYADDPELKLHLPRQSEFLAP